MMDSKTRIAKQKSLQSQFTALLLDNELSEMEINMLSDIQGLIIERLLKDKKLNTQRFTKSRYHKIRS